MSGESDLFPYLVPLRNFAARPRMIISLYSFQPPPCVPYTSLHSSCNATPHCTLSTYKHASCPI